MSALKCVKTYLRSTMKDNRLNHLMTLYVHKTRTDILNMTAIGNIFISNNDDRNRKFGMFRDGDIQKLIAKMQTRKQFEIRMLIFTVLICVLLIIFLHLTAPIFQLHFACDSRICLFRIQEKLF